jgi:phospholipid transport system substrate-binding protein
MMRLLLLTMLALGVPLAAAEPSTPEQVVRNTLQELAAIVSECRLPLAADPPAVRSLVEQHLRPQIDVLYAAQLILGRAWADATPGQRRRFADALYDSLAGRYAMGLLLLTEQNVRVLEGAVPGEGEAQVQLLVQAGLASPLPVTLQMRQSSNRWRVYDARWEGQSYVLSLRQAVAQEIRREGLEAVIERLEGSASTSIGLPTERPTAAGRCLRSRDASR